MIDKKPKVIKLCELSKQNKTQFLQFLARNNFAFQTNNGSYSAIVSIPNQSSQNTLKNRDMNKNANNNSKSNANTSIHKKQQKKNHIKNHHHQNENININKLSSNDNKSSKNKLMTPSKKSTQKIQHKRLQYSENRKSNKSAGIIIIQDNVSDANSIQSTVRKGHHRRRSATPAKSETSQISQIKMQRKQKEDFIKLNVLKAGAHKKQNKDKSKSKLPHSNNKIIHRKRVDSQCNAHISMKQIVPKIRQGFKSPQKKKVEQVQKYSSQFTIKLINQRPIKWNRVQLDKFVEQIYTKCFIRNTQLIHSHQFQNFFKNNKEQHKHFSKFVQKQIKKKYKNDKLIQFNLTNMLYSVSYYLHKDSQAFSLIIFQKLLSGYYLYEDMIFFLFARNCLQKQLGINMVQQADKQKFYKMDNHPKLQMKINHIQKFLKNIVGQQSTLVEQYEQTMLNQIKQKIKKDSQIVQKTSLNAFAVLKIMLDDYRQKRIYQSNEFLVQEDYQSNLNGLSNRLNDTLKKIEQRHQSFQAQLQQLTFGQDTQQCIQAQLNQSTQVFEFWDNRNLDTNTYNSLKQGQFQNIQLNDEFFNKVSKRLKRKVKQLINIIAGQHESQIQQKLYNLLDRKSQVLLKTIFQMSKIKWFKQLMIDNPSEQDIQKIQRFQVIIRKLKKNYSYYYSNKEQNEANEFDKQIGQFCKQLLTINKLTSELERILI